MATKAQIKATTNWLAQNGTRYETRADGVRVLGLLYIPAGTRVSLPAVTEVTGSVHVCGGGGLTARALVKALSIQVCEGGSLTADALGYVTRYAYVRGGGTLTARALARVACTVHVREGGSLIAPALRTIGHVAYPTTMFDHKVDVHGGIGSVVLSTQTRGGITMRHGRKARFAARRLVGKEVYIVSHGAHNAHGDTLADAMFSLAYKTANRDLAVYRDMPLDTAKPLRDWAAIYSVITGASGSKVREIAQWRGKIKPTYTLDEIIDMTQGIYCARRFRAAFASAPDCHG